MGPARLAARLALAALPLGGCLDTMDAKVSGSVGTEVRTLRRSDASPSGAAVAFASLEGAPAAVTARFDALLRGEATAREIVVAPPKEARYLVRGYLTAYAGDGGTTVAYVWDVFDRDRRRAQRMGDALTFKGTAADPWTMVDERGLASVAARGADDLAAFLSNTPEALAAAKAGAKAGTALSYAPVE